MKNFYRFFLMVLAICFFTNNVFSQETYVSLSGGYGLNMSSQNLSFLEFYNYTSGSNSYTVEQVNISLGKGLSFGGAIGYMFNERISAELGISYLLGEKSKAKDDYRLGKADYTISANMLRINPAVVIFSDFDIVNPYAKFGFIIGLGSINFSYEENDDGDILKLNLKMDGGSAIGLNAAIGALFPVSYNMSFFGEFNMVNMSHAPTKGEVTTATYNGIDMLPNMTTSEKEIEFVDSYTYNYNNPPADSKPSKELKKLFPFGSFGVNIGFRINF